MNQPFQFTIRQLLIVTALVAMTMWLITTYHAGEPSDTKTIALVVGVPTLVCSTIGVFVGRPWAWLTLGIVLGLLLLFFMWKGIRAWE